MGRLTDMNSLHAVLQHWLFDNLHAVLQHWSFDNLGQHVIDDIVYTAFLSIYDILPEASYRFEVNIS